MSASSTSSSALPSPTKVSPSSAAAAAASSAAVDRPPSPSGIRSALDSNNSSSRYEDPAAGMFTLGLDGDEEDEHPARPVPSAPAAADEQGYVMNQSRKVKGKKGYAAVDSAVDGPDDND